MKIEVEYRDTLHLLLKHYICNHRWIQDLFDGIQEAELYSPFAHSLAAKYWKRKSLVIMHKKMYGAKTRFQKNKRIDQQALLVPEKTAMNPLKNV